MYILGAYIHTQAHIYIYKIKKINIFNQAWRKIPLITALGKPKKVDFHEYEANMVSLLSFREVGLHSKSLSQNKG